MIDVGMIAYGPELERRAIFTEVRRLRNALVAMGASPQVEIVYLIPGSLGPPEVNGFSVARKRGRDQRILVYVDVPEAIAKSDEPLPGLLDLAASALQLIAPPSPAQQSVDIDRATTELQAARSMLLGGVASTPRVGRRVSSVGPPTTGASLIVRLEIDGGRDELRRAFGLEESLDAALEDASVGYVDGNQIGNGTFEIFAYGDDNARLREVVEKVLKTAWGRAGVEVEVAEGLGRDDRCAAGPDAPAHSLGSGQLDEDCLRGSRDPCSKRRRRGPSRRPRRRD